LYPSESQYGFSIERLLKEDVAFFVMRHDGIPAGCGGIKLFGTAYSEIKRMYVRPPFRGLGLGTAMLKHLTVYALHHSVHVLRLEMGIYQPEARRLYERCGFQRNPPFGDYEAGPFNLFYEKRLSLRNIDNGPSQRSGVRLLTHVCPQGTALRVTSMEPLGKKVIYLYRGIQKKTSCFQTLISMPL
jgi:putative acetyltransferase